MMFKILVLQALNSLSDEATEFQIKDCLRFQRFLGLRLDGTVPDATTVWLFRERLVQTKAIDKLFARFDAALTDRGYLAMGNQIIDAIFLRYVWEVNAEEWLVVMHGVAAKLTADRRGMPAEVRSNLAHRYPRILRTE